MTRLNLLLLAMVIGSALLLVKTAYDARRLFTDIHRAQTEAERLSPEHKRLEAERQEQATNLKVDAKARALLKMSTATPAITMYESAALPAVPAVAAAAAAASLSGASR